MSARGNVNRPVVQKGALPRGRLVKPIFGRVENHGDLRPAIDDKADGDRELRHAFDKFLGAVDGIDDPHARQRQAIRVVLVFFRKPTVVGKVFSNTLANDPIRFQVGAGDRIVFAFLVHVELAVETIP